MSRTARVVEALAQAIPADMAEVCAHLESAREKMDALRGSTAGVNGLANLLRQKATEVEKIAADLTDEADEAARKLRGQSRPALVEKVDHAAVEAVREARKAG